VLKEPLVILVHKALKVLKDLQVTTEHKVLKEHRVPLVT
jgi:phosphoribosylcarboxyaminoimidazole (NCAIR) mutase